MHSLISQIVILVFVVWILPLGVFVKPSQERSFCDGQRAICLCSHKAAAKAEAGVKTIAKAEGGTQKEHSGFSSSQYEAAARSMTIALVLCSNVATTDHYYQLLLSKSLDHVPKV